MYIIIAILLFGVLIAAPRNGATSSLPGSVVSPSMSLPSVWAPLSGSARGKKGTEFSLRALPIGGYCAMEGEEEESDDPRSLNNQGFWKKVFVFAAGAAMNFIVGLVIIFLLFLDAGAFYTPEITGFARSLPSRGRTASWKGDILYSIDGERIYIYNDVSLFLSRGDGDGFDLVVPPRTGRR